MKFFFQSCRNFLIMLTLFITLSTICIRAQAQSVESLQNYSESSCPPVELPGEESNQEKSETPFEESDDLVYLYTTDLTVFFITSASFLEFYNVSSIPRAPLPRPPRV